MTWVQDPNARVIVFVDGQNVYKRCFERYGHGVLHPLLLAERLKFGRRLKGVRYYTGMPDPRLDPGRNARAQRRSAFISKTGVTVVTRPLRYRQEWGIKPGTTLPDPAKSQGQSHKVDVVPFQRAREKGIDLVLALDVVDLALTDTLDVAVIVSTDADLSEVALYVKRYMSHARKGRVGVEAAVFSDKKKITMQHFDRTHQLTRNDFQHARDSFDYSHTLDPMMVQAFCNTSRSILD